MKKLMFCWSVAVFCVLMVSCTKEGQFNPKKKISTVSFSYTEKVEHMEGDTWVTDSDSSVSQHVSQKWEWYGDRLESIVHYKENGEIDYTEWFEYRKDKRLSAILSGPIDRYEFVYLKDMLTTIKYYHGFTYEAAYVITYWGRRIGEISYIAYSSRAAEAHPLPSFVLDALLSMPQVKGLEQVGSHKGAASCEYVFSWDKNGDNVVCIGCHSPASEMSFLFAYDNKSNPMSGLWEMGSMEGCEHSYADFGYQGFISKNNITHCSVLLDNKPLMDVQYTYTYKGDYPGSATWSYEYEDGGERHSASSTTVYEYQ